MTDDEKSFREAMGWMAEQKLTGEQWKVFAWIVPELGFDCWMRVDQKDLAERMGMHRNRVSRSIRRLKELGVLEEGPMAGAHKTYRLCLLEIGRRERGIRAKVLDFDKAKSKKRAARHGKNNEE